MPTNKNNTHLKASVPKRPTTKRTSGQKAFLRLLGDGPHLQLHLGRFLLGLGTLLLVELEAVAKRLKRGIGRHLVAVAAVRTRCGFEAVQGGVILQGWRQVEVVAFERRGRRQGSAGDGLNGRVLDEVQAETTIYTRYFSARSLSSVAANVLIFTE